MNVMSGAIAFWQTVVVPLIVAVGVGFTVIITLDNVPAQIFVVGIIEYVAIPNVVPEFVSVCTILLPDPSEAPVTSLCTTVHAKVVPETSDVKSILVAIPLHIV